MKRKQVQGIQRRKKRTSKARSFQNEQSQYSHSAKPILNVKKRNNISKNHFKKSFSLENVFSSFLLFLKKQWFWLQYLVKVFAVVMLLVVFYNTREKTSITILPHHEFQTIDELITIYKNPDIQQLGFDIIAITDEVSTSINPQGERTIEKKSQGTITLYNNYSTEPQRLLPETRFLSASNKLFRLGNAEVIIPGKTTNGPGKIDVIVYADDFGPEYNIGSTDFSVPGFKELGLDEKYKNIYAVSNTDFSGGVSGIEKYVDEKQKELVSIELQKQLEKRLITKLSKEKTDAVIVIKNSSYINYEDVYFRDTQGGELVQKGRITALVLGRELLKSFLLTLVDTSQDETLKVKRLDDLYIEQEDKVFDFEKDISTNILIQSSALLASDINDTNIKKQFSGISFNDIEHIFEKNLTLDRIQVQTRPFWKKRISSDKEKIFVEFQ
jgi:hypothetical protein